jgi:hypothetical protein
MRTLALDEVGLVSGGFTALGGGAIYGSTAGMFQAQLWPIMEALSKITGLVTTATMLGDVFDGPIDARQDTAWSNPANIDSTKYIKDALGNNIVVQISKNGTFWLDLDRDGKFESNFQFVNGQLYVNLENGKDKWVPCTRADWLRCGFGE